MRVCGAVITALALMAGCGDPGTGPATPGLTLSVRSIVDTIQAAVPDIEITARDDAGRPIPNAPVSLSVPPGFQNVQVPATDERGVSTVRMQLGVRAGEWSMVIGVASYEDTIHLTILPGAPDGVMAVPRDTALVRGESLDPDIRVRDRLLNARDERPTITAIAGAEPTLTEVGGKLTGAIEGVATLTISTSHGNTEARVTVLPPAEFAVLPGPALVTSTGAAAGDMHDDVEALCMRWHPHGDRLLLDGLRIVHPDGSMSRIKPDREDITAGCGEYSRNGAWIYFEGRRQTDPPGTWQIWRTRWDGSQTAQLTAPTAPTTHRFPSPSPDGSSVVFMYETAAVDDMGLVVLDVELGAADTLFGGKLVHPISRPRWSPTGEWIAYGFHGAVAATRDTIHTGAYAVVIGPDGKFHPSATRGAFTGELSWSPDGRWLVANGFINRQFVFLDVNGGAPLYSNLRTANHQLPAWRP